MLKNLKPIGLAAVAGSALLTGQVALAADVAPVSDAVAPVEATQNSMSAIIKGARVSIAKVEGIFNYSQSTLSSNDDLARAFKSSKYLCNSVYNNSCAQEVANPLDWKIAVGGEVENAFTASLDELSENGSAHVTMGCVCAANGAGGFAAVNADIKGIELASIMKAAGVGTQVNTIVFGCADGYEIALPLKYVEYRYSMIVYEVNGSNLRDSVGGTNQLWLGATAGNYFARDIVSITYETRQTPPPNPFTEEGDDYYGNFPGIGVRSAE